MSAQTDSWKVMSPEGVFETDFETLSAWISEGRVHPTDKVSRGSLRWVEAGKAPALRKIFDGTPASVPFTEPDPAVQDKSAAQDQALAPANSQASHLASARAQTQSYSNPHTTDCCHFHLEVSPKFVCRACGALFCAECVKGVGGNQAFLCPLCGDLCKLHSDVVAAVNYRQFQSSGFGASDFAAALRYPFRHTIALVFAAIVYGFCLLGGFQTQLFAWALLFGCLSKAINELSVGRPDRSFLPDFSTFNLLDDFIRPVFLGIGVTIVTIGPVILVMLFFMWQVVSPPSQAAVAPQAASQNQQITTKDFNNLINSRDEQKSQEIAQKIENLRRQTESLDNSGFSGRSTSPGESLRRAGSAPIATLLLLLVAIVWAFLYYPMAITVAGYTESFGSTVNPLVGIDTIRRMGGTYAKAFLMYIGVQVIGIVIIVIARVVTAPMTLPFMGNLPGTFISGLVTFYISMVIAGIMGFALFKSSDRLGIAVA